MRTSHRWAAQLTALVLLVTALLVVPAPSALAGPACQDRQRSTETPPAEGQSVDARPVVFVHGWTGNPMSETAEMLSTNLGEDISTFTFDYSPYGSYWANNDHISPCLADYVRDVSNEWAELTDGSDRRVLVVAHSMGGLAIRYAFDPAYSTTPLTSEDVAGVVTIATPYTGSPFGASVWAELKQTQASLFGDTRLPGLGSDGALCLAVHKGTQPLPPSCGSLPPWLPDGVSLAQIAGAITVDRTLFGRRLYSFGLDTDGIVPRDSALNYSAGGPSTGPPNADLPTWIDRCSVDSSRVLSPGPVPAPLMEGLARTSLSESVNPVIYGPVTLAAACSHTNITTDQSAINQATEAIRSRLAQLPTPRPRSYSPVLSTTGLGPVQFGDTVEVASSYLDDSLTSEGGSCWQSDQLPGISFVVHEGIVVGAGGFGSWQGPPDMVTDRGITPESTRAEFLDAYPGTEVSTSSGDFYTDHLVWFDGSGGVVQAFYSNVAGEADRAGGFFAGRLPDMQYEELCAG